MLPSVFYHSRFYLDDMLIAEIGTDSNLSTDIRHFQNRQALSASWETGPLPKNSTIEKDTPIASLPSNWARTSKAGMQGISNLLFALSDNNHVLGIDATRNSLDLILKSTVAIDDGVEFHLSMEA